MSAVVFSSSFHDAAVWRTALSSLLPGLDFRIWPDVGDPLEVDTLLIWEPPPDLAATFKRLRLVQCLAAGVDHLKDAGIPEDVPLARVTDKNQATKLAEYCLGAVLHFHRGFHLYRRDQVQRIWNPREPILAAQRRVAVMGLGALGAACAQSLVSAGFDVRGWSRTPKLLPGIASFSGDDQLDDFLADVDILVCMLPLTPATRGILNGSLFRRLPAGACIINLGRGEHCVEGDLLAAVRSGQIGGAILDVLQTEPPGQDHPFWEEPGIALTPHVATRVDTALAVQLVAENIQRVRTGQAPLNLVDRARGY